MRNWRRAAGSLRAAGAHRPRRLRRPRRRRGTDPGDGRRRERRPARRTVSAQVTRVIDGDTIEVRIGGASEDVRYIGIDTPEVEARRAGRVLRAPGERPQRRLVEGRTVRLVFDDELRDLYGRLLAYVYRRGASSSTRRSSARGYARTLTIAPEHRPRRLFRPPRARGRARRAAASGAPAEPRSRLPG